MNKRKSRSPSKRRRSRSPKQKSPKRSRSPRRTEVYDPRYPHYEHATIPSYEPSSTSVIVIEEYNPNHRYELPNSRTRSDIMFDALKEQLRHAL